MSNTIDEKVVKMSFDNAKFQSGVSESMSIIDKLKQSLQFTGVSKGFDSINAAANGVNMNAISSGVEQVKLKFSALEIAAITALSRIANQAITTGKNVIKSLTIDPISSGFSEYETKINAIQTIISNTASKGTTMSDVVSVIDELNTYADKTIYNFAEMTRNIGTFTAAGVGLEESASAIQGIANLAAASGSNSQQASTAMYQLSQALAAGTVKLMDWNSVVNAGMGGEKFQEALKATAREHGIAVDDIIERQGSFRDSLQEGWISADILNETLNKFTVDGAKNYAQAMMESGQWTQEQADALIKEAQAMEDAATKVKTFTQLMDTLKEAAQSGWGKTWEIVIGNFDEAKNIFTIASDTIGGMINQSSDARNNLLETWKTLGGRDMLLGSIQNGFEAIMIVVNGLSDAFREIFPPITALELAKITGKLEVLTSQFKLSEENAAKLKSVFKGVFATFDIGKKVISSLFDALSPGVGILGSVAQMFLDVASSIGDWLVSVNEGFDGFSGLAEITKTASEGISNAFDQLKSSVEKSPLPSFLEIVSGWFSSLGGYIQIGIDKLSAFTTSIFENISFDNIVKGLGVAGLGGIVGVIVKFIKNLTAPFDTIKDIGEAIIDILNQVKDVMVSYQEELKSKTLKNIAIAIGILAAALFVLSTIDPVQLTAALAAMAALFGELIVAMTIFSKFQIITKGVIKSITLMIGMSVAMLILAAAVRAIGTLDWEQLAKGLIGVTVLMGELVVMMKVLSANEKTVVKGAGSMIVMAIALRILVSSVKALSTLSWEEIAKGLLGVTVLMGELAIFSNTVKTKNILSTGAGLLLLSVGIRILASALVAISDLNPDQLITGLLGIGGMLVMIAGALKLMPDNMILIGAGLLIVSVGIRILAGAITTLGGMSWEQMAIGLIALGGAIAILAAGLYAMNGTIVGSAAMLVAAIALAALVPPLLMLGSMSLEQIGKSLLALAGIFLVFGVAAAVLTPLIVPMLGLAAALALLGVAVAAIGVGLMAAGIGIQAMAIGFGMLAGMTSAGAQAVVDALTTILTGVITLIPTLATALGQALIAFSQVVIEGAPIIAQALTSIISNFLATVSTLLPQVLALVGQLIVGLCELLVTNIPIIANAVFQIIVGILQTIATNIPQLIQAGVDIIVALAMGVATAVPQLVDAGFKAIIEFINGLADAIRNNTPAMIDAFNNLFDACVEAGKAVLANSIGGFLSAGQAIMDSGVISGITGKIGNLLSTISNGIQSAVDTVRGFIGSFIQTGKDIVNGLIEGIQSMVSSLVSTAAQMASDAWNAAKNALSSNSPSKKFIQLGEDSDRGMIIGLKRLSGLVASTAANTASGALSAAKSTITRLGQAIASEADTDLTIRPVFDLSEVQNGLNSMNSMIGSQSVSATLAAKADISTQTSQPSVSDIVNETVSSLMDKMFNNNNDESSTTIEVPVNLDGREIARVTAPHIDRELGSRWTLAARGHAL